MNLGFKYSFVVAILVIFQLFCLIRFKCEFYLNPEADQSGNELHDPELDKLLHNFSHHREYDKWILDFLLQTNPTQKDFPFSKYELDFHLRLRQVLLFGIHEVNQKLVGTNCSKLWANALSAFRLSHRMKNNGIITYNLMVEVQPGRIPLRISVEIQTQSRKNGLETLKLLEAALLGASVRSCPHISPEIHKICHYSEKSDDAKKATTRLREKWAKTDPELVTWPPNVSFMVGDYMTVGNLNTYLQYPKHRKADYCGIKTKLVIFVSTAPGDITSRKAVRETYASSEALKNLDVKILFITDRDRNSTIQNIVREEAEKFDDLVQADHIHSYHNLTLRYLNIFNWLETHCKQQNLPLPPWIIKTDGDYFINVRLALRAISANNEAEIMGILNCGQGPIRDVSYMFKYYTPKYIFTARHYPGYISGATWLIRRDVIPNLLRASLVTPMIHVDDVYVMGMLTRAINVQPKYLQLITYGAIKPGPCEVKHMINANVMNYTDMKYHWKNLNEPLTNNCIFNEAKLIAQPTSEADKKSHYVELINITKIMSKENSKTDKDISWLKSMLSKRQTLRAHIFRYVNLHQNTSIGSLDFTVGHGFQVASLPNQRDLKPYNSYVASKSFQKSK